MTASKARQDKTVIARPEKRFFISMLVKDIELIPAILDLVDNSIDGAKRIRPGGKARGRKRASRFAGLYVDLEVGADEFVIRDNCGGIEIEQARNYAFRFGRAEDIHGPVGEVGQFGIGMKRALFKLGNRFLIESAADSSRFTLPVDVRKWSKDKRRNWTFRFDVVEEGVDVPEAERGTRITVRELHPSVALELGTGLAVSRLRTDLELRHQRALDQGLAVRLNGKQLNPVVPRLAWSDEFIPLHREDKVRDAGGVVEMAVYAGLEPSDDEDVDTDEAEPVQTRAGWYFFCNDRLLFSADKSPLTGWGTAAAAYHPQYRLFRGYVFLSAADSSLLPWNTSKTGVDQDSGFFVAAQREMFNALRMAQAVMNRLKTERQTRPEDDRIVTEALAHAEPTELSELPVSETFVVPNDPPRRRRPSRLKPIRYSVEPDDFDAVAEQVGTDSAPEVGRETFYHYLMTEVPE